jgi:hypothetical protein
LLKHRSPSENPTYRGAARTIPDPPRKLVNELVQPLIIQRTSGPAGQDEVLCAEMLRKSAVLLGFGIVDWQPVADVVRVAEYRPVHTPGNQRHESHGDNQLYCGAVPQVSRFSSHLAENLAVAFAQVNT